ncbi:uncharacterized protein LOC120017183 [Tripterygium wilfordii]|uniref:uncharacterized protein LOC120017183 n=1 Tax=Tripterygium wilfordii TaxID=458696 RepID=UPI0018F860FC|nr:uncharacterized protein LOC120017183 [Tripterygium wilfordii]XP_038726254.1 uncharacterized protein LOC120017183 [Tripterygium wilfordii]
MVPLPQYISENKSFSCRGVWSAEDLISIYSVSASILSLARISAFIECHQTTPEFTHWWTEYVNQKFSHNVEELLAIVAPDPRLNGPGDSGSVHASSKDNDSHEVGSVVSKKTPSTLQKLGKTMAIRSVAKRSGVGQRLRSSKRTL